MMTTKDTKFWLDEQELKTPIHDEMVLWTFNNIKTIFKKINLIFDTRQDFTAEEIKICADKGIDRKQSINITTKTIESPLKGYNGFNLGYLDLLIKLKINNGSFVITKDTYDSSSEYNVGFEIKPFVKSIGEVLRQFQYYKSNMSPFTKLVLVTQTTGLKEIFESQGFCVFEYKKEELCNKNKPLF